MKVVVTSPSFSKNKNLTNELKNLFSDIKLNDNGKLFSKEDLIEFIGDAEAVIIGLDKINEEVINKCSRLKIVSKYGVGLDNIDLQACKKSGIKIGWTGGVNKLSVAEMTLGFMLMLVRNLYITSNQLKTAKWNKNGGFQLSEKTIGIIGVGNIGKEVIRLLKPFNCQIFVNDIVDQSSYYEENSLVETGKSEIFERSDIVTLHTNLDENTKNLVDLNVLKKMKKNSYLINTSRSGVIVESDLKYALQNGIIAGAAIDVYSCEPPSDYELLSLPNLVCTPHIGGNAREAVEAMGMSAIGHLKKYYNL
jgi:D-3-phosphoglycerate dehydrogenase